MGGGGGGVGGGSINVTVTMSDKAVKKNQKNSASGFPSLPRKSDDPKLFSPFQKINCGLFRSALVAK